MIRRLLFILFLYFLLVWLIAAYMYNGDLQKLIQTGILWSAIGVGALLLWLILERGIGWWKARKAQPGVRTASPAVVQVRPTGNAPSEDKNSLESLIREANQRLAASPRAGQSKPTSVTDLPVYLVVGAEGSGKTSAIHNAGIDAALLAGQVAGSGGVTPTRIANLWLVQDSIFVEIGGRVFDGDANRLADFLRPLQPASTGPAWLRKFLPASSATSIRGILLCVDGRNFLGTPDPSKLDQAGQKIRERLFALCSAVNSECPVYVLFTRTDTLPYFPDFFRHLSEAESGQLVGVMVPENLPDDGQNRVWAEAQTKLLNRLFQSIFTRFSDWRLRALAREVETDRKPAIYEFPREFKRIRTQLVQFMVDVFRPDPLSVGPTMRGFFFSATRQSQQAVAEPQSNPDASIYVSPSSSPDATQFFSPKAQAELAAALNRPSSSTRSVTVDQWVFLQQFLRDVLLKDRPSVKRATVASSGSRYQQFALAGVSALAAILAILWTVSWFTNLQLTGEAKDRISDLRKSPDTLNFANLESLDRLRQFIVETELQDNWLRHWGLYTGNRVLAAAETAYFSRLKELSLGQIHDRLAQRMVQLAAGGEGAGWDPVYDRLKTHRIMTVLACPADGAVMSRTLKATSAETYPSLGAREQQLLGTQLDFYISRFQDRDAPPVKLAEITSAEERARAFLRDARGLDQKLGLLVAKVRQQVKPLNVADLVDNYKAVLSGPAQFPGEFTKPGLALFEELVAKGDFGGSGERCVTGETLAGQATEILDTETKDRIKSLYYRQYADAWRDFLGSYQVIAFGSAEDAQRKLSILDSPTSPLLGIVRLVAINTNFPAATAGQTGFWDKMATRVGLGSAVEAKNRAESATERLQQLMASDAPPMTPPDVSRLFQPVLLTTPPDLPRVVSDANNGYVTGLRSLEQAMAALARASSTDMPPAIQQAQGVLDQARGAHRGLADKFEDVGSEGLNKVLSDLLERPIQLAAARVPANATKFSGGQKNGELKRFCDAIGPMLSKFPFTSTSLTDATSAEVIKNFAPGQGLVSKFVQEAAADVVLLQGKQFQPNPAAQGMRAAPELLQFLNRSQQLTDALFSATPAQPGFRYVLRPISGQSVGTKLVIDGTELNPENPLQRTFEWPARPGARQGAEGFYVVGGASAGFGKFDGLWGVFRLFQNADARAEGTRVVNWSQVRGPGGAALQSLNPPAKIEIVDFPGGIDIFNPSFLQGLRCPQRAVVVN